MSAICPIAIYAGCKACPVYKICPAKGILGDEVKKDKKESRDSEEKKNDD